MQTPKKIVVAFLTSIAIAGGVQAQVVGIDLYNDPSNSGPPSYTPTNNSTGQIPGSVAVVGPYASAGWNNEFNVGSVGGPINLLDNTGSAVAGATFGFTQGGNAVDGSPIYNSGYGATGSANLTLTADQQLYNGAAYASPAGFSQQAVLSNIPFLTYNVYVLVGAQDGAVGYPYPTGGYGNLTLYTNYSSGSNTGTAGSSYWFYNSTSSATPPAGFSYIAATGTSQATATQGGNYVEFTGLTGANVAFDLTSPNADGNAGAFITGIEIVNTTAVPEPATYLMMLGGVFALVGIRRLRNRAL